ncbi:hypothetical protein NPA30_13115 [Aurantimonas sp. CSK15Z-1]|nr:hypothetical protein [Aurantimonas sp. CSK15Z-1]
MRIRFPGQDPSFAAGVEIGMLATLMSQKPREFSRQISAVNVDQARIVGRKLGYAIAEMEEASPGEMRVTFRDTSIAPKLKLIRCTG